MVCFHPIHAYYPLHSSIDYYTGEQKRHILFTPPKFDYSEQYINGAAYYDYDTVLYHSDLLNHDFKIKSPIVGTIVPNYIDIKIPCGKCIGCHAARARNYATRAIHEFQMYKNRDLPSSFVTLTFNDEMLHKRDVLNWRSVYRSELSGFVKRLRERVYDKYGTIFRVFACGEYGELHTRPHYHLLIYGFDFPDKYYFNSRGYGKKAVTLYRSDFLEKIWSPAYESNSFGFSTIGEVNQSSCQYVAGYMSSKLDEFGKEDYKKLGIEKPFFYTPSKVGLGHDYLLKYYKSIFECGYCNWHNSIKAPIPAYYTSLLKKYYIDDYNRYKLDKLKFMIDNLFIEHLDLTEQRLRVREEVLKMTYDRSIRSYEELSNLHNIYYKYISVRYKKAVKVLKLLDFNFKLDIEDARQVIKKDNDSYNFIFLDAFTPAKCPCLWSIDFFKELYKRLDNNGMILTYSNSANIRNAFLNAGFYVGKIYSDSSKKFMGTVAVKNKSLIKDELSEYDLGLIKTRAGIFYRDENLTLDNEAIIKQHEIDVKNSTLISSSKYIKMCKSNKS